MAPLAYFSATPINYLETGAAVQSDSTLTPLASSLSVRAFATPCP